MTLTSQLQAAIRDLHERIERLPLAQQMASGTIDRPTYRLLLEQLLHLHWVAEGLWGQQPALESLYAPSMARVGDLLADLTALPGGSPTEEPLLAVRRFTGRMTREWAESPAALAGCLYVLEGSRMGSMVLAPALARGLGLAMQPGRGLDYHIRDLPQRPMQWRAFKTALETLPAALEDPNAVLEGAVQTMKALFEIYEAVCVCGNKPTEETSVPCEAGAAA